MVLDTKEKISSVLEDYPVEDLWGVGRQYANKLISMGIKSAAQLRAMPIDWIQKHMTIVGVRIWRELWGDSCIPLKLHLDRKKGLCTSRAFGKTTGDYTELQEAVVNYTSRLASKLRRERCCATVISIRLLTNRFSVTEPQAFPSITIPLVHPVNNTTDLVNATLSGLQKIFLRGYLYQKVEVTAIGLIPETEVHFGAGTLRIATEGEKQRWTLRREFLSPSYTTNWNDIIKVK